MGMVMRYFSLFLFTVIFFLPFDSTWAQAKRKSWTVTKIVESAEGGCCDSPILYCAQYIEYQNGDCTVSDSSERYNYDGGSCTSCGYKCVLTCVPEPAGGMSIVSEEDPVKK